ncbi:unnamed protein product [Nezara viridula]|uniref:Uncharacterized protein n=1 Tax=Nezara viridula TaxID=85310 RepID=A0A9P0H1D8_NEZVI|nr:unnamed protein product [Nezara viridula]
MLQIQWRARYIDGRIDMRRTDEAVKGRRGKPIQFGLFKVSFMFKFGFILSQYYLPSLKYLNYLDIIILDFKHFKPWRMEDVRYPDRQYVLKTRNLTSSRTIGPSHASITFASVHKSNALFHLAARSDNQMITWALLR